MAAVAVAVTPVAVVMNPTAGTAMPAAIGGAVQTMQRSAPTDGSNVMRGRVLSERLVPTQGDLPTLVHVAEFDHEMCWNCWGGSEAKARKYALIWDNKLETNYAVGACACLTPNETCVFDRITTIHFDRSPMRNGMCCYCIPATCCGPPVIYSKEQKICGVLSTAPCCGVGIYASPCRSDTAFRLCVALPFFAKTVPFLVAVAAGT